MLLNTLRCDNTRLKFWLRHWHQASSKAMPPRREQYISVIGGEEITLPKDLLSPDLTPSQCRNETSLGDTDRDGSGERTKTTRPTSHDLGFAEMSGACDVHAPHSSLLLDPLMLDPPLVAPCSHTHGRAAPHRTPRTPRTEGIWLIWPTRIRNHSPACGSIPMIHMEKMT
jgi:hypothetical protein